MSDQQQRGGGEPSMEEILASIRKIISDEGEEQPEKDDGPDSGGDAPEAGLVRDDAAAGQDVAGGDGEFALDLTEDEETGADAESDDDVLELTEEVEESSVVDLGAAREQARAGHEQDEAVAEEPGAADEEPEAAGLLEDVVTGEEGVAKDEPDEEEASGMTADSGGDRATRHEPIVSEETSTAATSALTELARAANAGDGIGGGPKSDADRILEQLVREALRPQLKAWLDENLPGLVERIVRSEVRRISRRAETIAEDEQDG